MLTYENFVAVLLTAIEQTELNIAYTQELLDTHALGRSLSITCLPRGVEANQGRKWQGRGHGLIQARARAAAFTPSSVTTPETVTSSDASALAANSSHMARAPLGSPPRPLSRSPAACGSRDRRPGCW